MRRSDGCLRVAIRARDDGVWSGTEIVPTRVSCKLFDTERCTCTDYANRRKYVPDCIKLTPHNIDALPWMPLSCAYRRLNEGKDLPGWHPLITGDPETVHKAGASVRGQTISETVLANEEDALDYPGEDLMDDKSDATWED